MTDGHSPVLLEGLILIEDGADARRDRIVRDNGRVRKSIVFVSEPAEGPRIAIELADQGVQLIELDGGFGSLWAAEIFEAIGGRAAVGFVSFGIESMDRVAAFKQRYEAQVEKEATHDAPRSFLEVLQAAGPDTEREPKLALYAWLIGQWEFDVTTILEDGSTHRGRGEISAGWILQGRAIQDVWMIPRLRDRQSSIEQLPGAGNWYGTTLRIYDPGLDAWRILWNDPATNYFTQQIGRARGRDIVQEGSDPNGGKARWVFTEIQPTSFHWIAESSVDGTNWRKQVDIRARRVAGA